MTTEELLEKLNFIQKMKCKTKILELKSAEIGYTLPKDVCKKLHSSGVRFYVSGNNLFTISKFKLWDPEILNSQGSSYPNMRAVNFGATFNF